MTQTDYTIAPSANAIELFENQVYMYGPEEVATIIVPGDLRGKSGSYEYKERLADNILQDIEKPRIIISMEKPSFYNEILFCIYLCRSGKPT
jgi:hypothetical protein